MTTIKGTDLEKKRGGPRGHRFNRFKKEGEV